MMQPALSTLKSSAFPAESVIETTGLADPTPIAALFNTDALLRERFRLAGIVTTLSATSGLQVLASHSDALSQVQTANLVIINHALGGWVDAAASPESASFSLRVPVAEFTVDDAQARSEEGPDFAAEVPEDEGTRPT